MRENSGEIPGRNIEDNLKGSLVAIAGRIPYEMPDITPAKSGNIAERTLAEMSGRIFEELPAEPLENLQEKNLEETILA